jgi:hypothetical protein
MLNRAPASKVEALPIASHQLVVSFSLLILALRLSPVVGPSTGFPRPLPVENIARGTLTRL